jgi:hypothetical protein
MRSVVVTVAVGTVLALLFCYVVLRALAAGWGP